MSGDSFDTAMFQWREGERRVRDAPPTDRVVLERVVDRAVAELRRRLGGPFTASELADLYGRLGTTWVMDLASRVAPDDPQAWDPRVADAAYARYVREASDFAGGRLVLE